VIKFISAQQLNNVFHKQCQNTETFIHGTKGNTTHISFFDVFDEYELINYFIELIDSRPCTNKDLAA
jgi:hypothetical protein